MIINPWEKINTENNEYILDVDKAIIDKHNKNRNKDDKIRYNNPPTPYAGDFQNAKILLLQLNPGSEIFPGLNPSEDFEFKIYKNLEKDIFKSLRHEKMEFPFYWLNPEYILTGGFRYWVKIFSTVLKEKSDYKKLANKICCAQYFPYHSKRYRAINGILKSQEYTFALVKDFIAKPNKLIIMMRAQNEWLSNKAIPELKNIPYATLRANRNPVLTKNNFSKKENHKTFLKYLDL
ncbi:hypothetical protein KAR28_02215 [Candidatus Parcubacteria bacterium]|nr:hypothetical protein [Candidatus Parcubacteria bacterium]